jgi:hypothetical protein
MNAHRRESQNSAAHLHHSSSPLMEIRLKHHALNLYGRVKGLGRREIGELSRLIDLHACREEWDRVVDLASRAVVLGLSGQDEAAMYRIWIEALNEDLDTEGLAELGRHLLARRDESSQYLALGALSFLYAGKKRAVSSTVGQLYRAEAKGGVVDEVLAIVKCESMHREERMMGLRLLSATLKESGTGYLAYRRFLHYAWESDALSTAAATLKSMAKRFPESADAHFVSALIDIQEGQWPSAISALRAVLARTPENVEAVLMMSRCLEMTGRHSEARFALLNNAHLFSQGEYEFHVQLGMLEKKIAESKKSEKMMRESAIHHLKTALRAAPLYGLPEAPIRSVLVDMGALSSEPEAPRQRYWLLSVGPKPLAALLEREDFQMRSSANMQVGDVVFFSAEGRGVPGTHAISGFFKVRSEPIQDPALGLTVRTGNAVVFERDVTISQRDGIFAERDAYGLDNFSTESQAKFYEVDASIADSVISKVEGMRVHMAIAV